VEPSVVVDIDINAFRTVLSGNGNYSMKLLNKVSQDGLFIFDRLMAQTHKQLPEELQTFFCTLLKLFTGVHRIPYR
jgi:hypothetical protein